MHGGDGRQQEGKVSERLVDKLDKEGTEGLRAIEKVLLSTLAVPSCPCTEERSEEPDMSTWYADEASKLLIEPAQHALEVRRVRAW